MSHEFNWKFYVTYYEDLKNNNIDTLEKALNHYYCFGKKENRITNLNMLTDSSYKNHLDVYFYKHIYDPHNNTFKNANDCINHWIRYGKKEGLVNNKKALSLRLTNNIYKIQKQFKYYKYKECNINNKINILIRTSNRPILFEQCVNSIFYQTYSNYIVYASYDNDSTLSYIKKYPRVIPISVKNKYSGNYHYNLYCNDLLDCINDGYIIFLDDDDMFTHNCCLQIINSQLDKNKVLLWNFLRPDKIISPCINSNKFKLGTIANCSVCFFYTHKRLSIWNKIQNADYHFFLPILNILQANIIDLSLTRTIYTDRIQNHGKIPNINSKLGKLMYFENIKKLLHIDLNMLDEPIINMFDCKLDYILLKKIYNNINSFHKMILDFKNILLLCYDPPRVGGASNNTLHLYHFFKKTRKICKTIFISNNINNNSINNEDIIHITLDKLEEHLKTTKFNPDLIITKSPIHIDITEIYDVPIIYLISGIYNNSLNVSYCSLKTTKEHDIFINKNVINQIHRSNYTFCNSSHTQEILKKYYNINTNLFYSSLVPYFNKKILKDPYFDMREYDYAIICSDFIRPIKNIKLSIQKLKDKKNIILIGNNSHLFKSKNITTLPYIDNISSILYKIKYILIDSFYESSSNLQIESIFSGCKLFNDTFCKKCNIHFKNNNEYNNHISKYHSKNIVLSENNIYLLQIISSTDYYEKIIIDPIHFKKTTNLKVKNILQYFNINTKINIINIYLFYIKDGNFVSTIIYPMS